MRLITFGVIVFSLLLSILNSCKKDEDTESPRISISSPYENTIYNVFDVVSVQASVSDNKQLESVSVGLLDAQMNVAYISVPATITSPSTNINVSYYLDDIHLESGIYYIKVTASDGENNINAYKKIQINAVPKALKKVFLVTKPSSVQTNISYVDSTFSNIVPYQSFSGDHIGSSVSSYFQQMYSCGNYTGAFRSIDLSNNAVKFTVPCVQSVYPYFTGYLGFEKTVYVSFYSGMLRGYDHNGNIVYSAAANSGHYVQNFTFSGGYLLAEQVDQQTAARVLTSHQTTGVGYQQLGLTQDVVAFCEKNNENMFVFGNVSGQATIQLFDRNANNLWNPYPFSLATGALLSAVKIDSNTFLLGHSNGTIYKYQYQPSSVTTYLSGYVAKQLIYDDLNDDVYIVEDNALTRVYYSSGGVHNSVSSSETILSASLLFNR